MRLHTLLPLVLGVIFSAGDARAAESDVAAPLCEMLKTLVPEVRTYQPEGARAQLVIAMMEKFDADGDALRKAWAEIDRATTATCPKDRDAMIAVTKTTTLKEAMQ